MSRKMGVRGAITEHSIRSRPDRIEGWVRVRRPAADGDGFHESQPGSRRGGHDSVTCRGESSRVRGGIRECRDTWLSEVSESAAKSVCSGSPRSWIQSAGCRHRTARRYDSLMGDVGDNSVLRRSLGARPLMAGPGEVSQTGPAVTNHRADGASASPGPGRSCGRQTTGWNPSRWPTRPDTGRGRRCRGRRCHDTTAGRC